MKKIAIFTEGQSELIFVRELLNHLVDLSKISFECIKLHSNTMIPAKYNYENKNAQLHFLIINVENDNRVLSAIKEREENFFKNGYERIFGLRDMYSEAYRKKSPNKIDEELNSQIIEITLKELEKTSNPLKISFHYAIMEFESWLLAMHTIFPKINTKLSLNFIEETLNFNLEKIDPQTEFFHPADSLNKIFNLINLNYSKKESEVESICSKFEFEDFKNFFNSNKCTTYFEFLNKLTELDNFYPL